MGGMSKWNMVLTAFEYLPMKSGASSDDVIRVVKDKFNVDLDNQPDRGLIGRVRGKLSRAKKKPEEKPKDKKVKSEPKAPKMVESDAPISALISQLLVNRQTQDTLKAEETRLVERIRLKHETQTQILTEAGVLSPVLSPTNPEPLAPAPAPIG